MLLACNVLFLLVGRWTLILSDSSDVAAALSRAAGGSVWLGILEAWSGDVTFLFIWMQCLQSSCGLLKCLAAGFVSISRN